MVGNKYIDTRLWDYYFASSESYDEFLEESIGLEMSGETKNEEPDSDEFRYT